jgi:DEAD/DEAH box helicase domain-containing protein
MYIVFDIESKKIFEEVENGNHAELGISYLAYYRSDEDKIEGVFENDVIKFKEFIDKADLVIGYNIIDFDFPVLKAYFDFKLEANRICDLYKIIYQQTGVYLKLDNITQATFGAGKIAHGLDAIRFYREGNLDKLKEYCDMDVKLTTDLYKFIKENGYCFYTDGLGNKVKLDVKLSDQPTIATPTESSNDGGLGLF